MIIHGHSCFKASIRSSTVTTHVPKRQLQSHRTVAAVVIMRSGTIIFRL